MTGLLRNIGEEGAADLVVVGGGGSGLAAAVTAAEGGASVILLEKNSALGGTTSLAVGSFSAAGTSLQRRAGITDTAAQFCQDLIVANGTLEARENAALRAVLVEHCVEAFEWMRSLGLEFLGPTEEPPFTRPRMHNVIPSSRAYVQAMLQAARRGGVVVKTEFPVERLLRDPVGRIVGVEGPTRIQANMGVVLATGDYSASTDLKARLVSPLCAALPAINPASTGDGHLMGLEVGGEIVNGDRALEELRLPPAKGAIVDLIGQIPSSRLMARILRIAVERLPRAIVGRIFRSVLTGYVAPSGALIKAGGILVNQDGRRFASEEDNPARALGAERDNRCYVVFDATVAELVSKWPNPLSTFPGVAYAYLQDYVRFRPDAVHRAYSVAELAAAIGIRAGELQGTIERYNGAIHNGVSDEFGRLKLGSGVSRPPFYALGPLKAYVTLTDGGLAVDDDCRVLDVREDPIAGLYAVGSVGQGGLILANHGLHIAWAITSGRIAARAVLKHAGSKLLAAR